MDDVSSNLLINDVFDQCCWQVSAYMQATEEIRQTLPVITTVGFYEEDGNLTDTLSPEGQIALDTFHKMEYYYYRNFLYREE